MLIFGPVSLNKPKFFQFSHKLNINYTCETLYIQKNSNVIMEVFFFSF